MAAKERALAILFSAAEIIDSGCVGQIAEVLDGHAPHSLRGCGAQAWGITEFYRVYKLITN
jgi:glycogen debranching enzyme